MSTPADNPFQCNGSGKKKQIVQCRVNKKIIKNKNDARRVCGRQPPVREKQCKLSLENCRVPYQWHVRSDWSECSVTCGTDGTEFRDVVCINVSLLDINRSMHSGAQLFTLMHRTLYLNLILAENKESGAG